MIVLNQATGGVGGRGADGGDALGGGVFNGRFQVVQPATLTIRDSFIIANRATGGTGGAGGNGGNGFGGGIFNGNPKDADPGPPFPMLHLFDTQVTDNQAVGGAAGLGGTVGLGQGGGLYNQTGAVASADPHTKIKRNKATTSIFDDIFGVVTPI